MWYHGWNDPSGLTLAVSQTWVPLIQIRWFETWVSQSKWPYIAVSLIFGQTPLVCCGSTTQLRYPGVLRTQMDAARLHAGCSSTNSYGKFIGLGSIPYTNCHIPWKMKCPPSLDVFHGYLARRKPFLSGHWLHINNWTPNLDHLAPSGAQRAQRAQPENPGSWTPWSRIDHCCP